MKTISYLLALSGLALSLLAGCRSQTADGCRPDPAASAPPAPVALRHLEPAFFQIQNPAQGLQFARANPVFARFYLQAGRVPADTLGRFLSQLATNDGLRKLGRETAAAFADSAGLRRDLGAMLGRAKFYFPDFRAPRTAVTNVGGLLGKDIFVNDSLLVLNLDWFAGPRASYRPPLPRYMLRRCAPPYVLPTLALYLADKYNRHQLTATNMLDQMVNQGKRLYFAGQLLPCASDSLLLGYTGAELRSLQANEGKVWAHFLENNLLYSTTPFEVQKYVGERPNVPEIDRTCPGRVGQWVGLQIVRKYVAEHPAATLAQVMAEKDAQKLLNESHYRPKR